MKTDILANRMGLANRRLSIPASKLLSGSITDKFPVILDGGKTIIFIADKSLEAETRYRYEVRKHS